MDTKFKDNETTKKKSTTIKKVILFIVSSIILIIASGILSFIFYTNLKANFIANNVGSTEYIKKIDTIIDKEIIPDIFAQKYNQNPAEFTAFIEKGRDEFNLNKEKEYNNSVNSKLEMLTEQIVNDYFQGDGELTLKFYDLLEKNKSNYNKDAENLYAEKLNYLHNTLKKVELEDWAQSEIVLNIEAERSQIESFDIGWDGDIDKFYKLGTKAIESDGAISDITKNFSYMLVEKQYSLNDLNSSKDSIACLVMDNEDNFSIGIKDGLYRNFHAGNYSESMMFLNFAIEELYGVGYTIEINVDKNELLTENYGYNRVRNTSIQSIEESMMGVALIVGITIILMGIFIKFNDSVIMLIHRKTPVLINWGLFIGILVFTTIIVGNEFGTSLFLLYINVMATIIAVQYLMLTTDIAYIIDHGFKERYSVDLIILRAINIFRFINFAGGKNTIKNGVSKVLEVRNSDGVKKVSETSPKVVNRVKNFIVDTIIDIRSSKHKSELVYKIAVLVGFIGLLVMAYNIVWLWQSYFLDITMSISFIVVTILYTYMFIKMKRLKQDISDIERATSSIADGDFNINFKSEKVKDLNTIRENIRSIDKGFKVAIEDELKSERMKAELITNVSHDLKTPLTSIINYVDLLQKDGIDEEDKKDYLKILDHKSKRLKVLIEDLFEASKASTGNLNLNIERIDIVSVLRQTLAEFKERIDESSLDFKVNVPDNKVMLDLDGARMWRVFENLIGNALKYSMHHSRVYLDLKETHDKVIFEIKNISAYELNCDPSELKERFKRADSSRNSEGSGLGLSIANGLIEAQGGNLDISVDGDLFKIIIEFKKVK